MCHSIHSASFLRFEFFSSKFCYFWLYTFLRFLGFSDLISLNSIWDFSNHNWIFSSVIGYWETCRKTQENYWTFDKTKTSEQGLIGFFIFFLIKAKEWEKHTKKHSKIFYFAFALFFLSYFLRNQMVDMLGTGLRFGALRGEDRFYIPVKARKNQREQKQGRRWWVATAAGGINEKKKKKKSVG